MKSRFWKRGGFDVEAELRASRPEAPEYLVRAISNRVTPKPLRSTRSRVGMVGVLAAASIAVLGATGGFSYAASSIAHVATVTAHVTHLSAATHTAAPPHQPPNTGGKGDGQSPGGSSSSGSGSSSSGSGGSATSGGGSSASAVYGVHPTISSLSPTTVVGGQSGKLIVHGTALSGATRVDFPGGNSVSSGITVTGDGKTLSVGPPTGANGGVGPVTVTTDGGVAMSNQNLTLVESPNLASVSSSALAAGETITLTGTGFTGATEVDFIASGKSQGKATPNVVSDTSATVVVPFGLKASSGDHISITNKAGTSSKAVSWTYTQTVPTIKKFSPTSGIADLQQNGPAAVITITGANFDVSDTVKIGGFTVPGGNVTNVTPTSMQVKVPAGAQTGSIQVFASNNGGSTATGTFTVFHTPAPSAATPLISSGVYGTKSGGQLTITGSGLTGATLVTFAGSSKNTAKPAASKSNPDGSITVVVPSGATSGAVSVAGPAGNGAVPGSFYLVVKPTLDATTPFSQSGTTLTINGTGFTGTSTVSIGKVNVAAGDFTSLTDTKIVLTVPSGTPAGAVTVTNAAGSSKPSKASIVGAPTISSAANKTTSNTLITVMGTSLWKVDKSNPTVAITVNGVGATPSNIQTTGTKLTFTVPSVAKKATVVVTISNELGTATSKSFKAS